MGACRLLLGRDPKEDFPRPSIAFYRDISDSTFSSAQVVGKADLILLETDAYLQICDVSRQLNVIKRFN